MSGMYFMESLEETHRLEIKTDPEAVRSQAVWCGLKPGMRVLDAGCGTGKASSILYEFIQPGGSLVGLDSSAERVLFARRHYGVDGNLEFRHHDILKPLQGEEFDLVWIRFVLEYFRGESSQIVKNLTGALKPGGTLCLLDLDYNCLNHYEVPEELQNVLERIIKQLEATQNFDPYAGRKLYSYLYDLGFKDIQVDLRAHHLIYGKLSYENAFNWLKKIEATSEKAKEAFTVYPGGYDQFFADFRKFFADPRRFTYTPLVICKGIKP